MKNYHIYIHSDKHPRTINSYAKSRCYYTKITVQGKQELTEKVAELKACGAFITEITTDMGTRIWM